MPLQQTSGNDTQDAYGGGKAVVPVYVENVFSTYLYTGTGATQSITNSIDLSTKGGMVWIKDRTTNSTNNNLFDTIQGATKLTHSNTTAATVTDTNSLTAFNTTGFTLGSGNTSGNQVNTSGDNFVSWTFRKQPKFFDIVTYTGTGSAHTISHNLGSAPGCIIVKRTDTTSNWQVYHSGLTSAAYSIQLNLANAQASAPTVWNSTAPTSTVFSVGTDATVNASGGTYVAYLFASNAGGFGLTGTDNVITCGSFTTDSSDNASVNLGYEPQWLMVNCVSAASNWYMFDVMRGFSQTTLLYLNPNQAQLENSASNSPSYLIPNATGFATGQAGFFAPNQQIIYIAIRRGPMAVPTDPTKVFKPVVVNSPTSGQLETTNFPVDLLIEGENSQSTSAYWYDIDRLRGSLSTSSATLFTNVGRVESTTTSGFGFDSNVGVTDYHNSSLGVADNVTYWNFSRAPGFMDIVCYSGTGSVQTINHNLNAIPQLIFVKARTGSSAGWYVYVSSLGNTGYVKLDATNAFATDSTVWNNTNPTSTNFTIGTSPNVNSSGGTLVAYLFATLAGVSYVGSYTGNGTGQSIACGFGASGARFVLIKRTDSSGNWYVFDSANGLTSSSSPYIWWNSNAAQTTGNNGVYASSGGFTLGATAITTTNIATASYIFLAIA